MANTALAIATIAALLLFAGGLYLLATGRDRKKGALMLLMAAVLLANVAIWSAPLPR